MSNINDVLSKSSVFDSLESEDLKRVGALFERRETHTGDVLASADHTAQYFFLLGQGTILLAMDEGKSIVLKDEGDFAGMELLSAKGIYKTTLTALGNGSVFVITRQDFLDVIREDSSAAAVIMGAWQEYLEKTAPFAKNIEDVSLPEHF